MLSHDSPTQVIPSLKYPALHAQLDISTEDPDTQKFDNVAYKLHILQGLNREHRKLKRVMHIFDPTMDLHEGPKIILFKLCQPQRIWTRWTAFHLTIMTQSSPFISDLDLNYKFKPFEIETKISTTTCMLHRRHNIQRYKYKQQSLGYSLADMGLPLWQPRSTYCILRFKPFASVCFTLVTVLASIQKQISSEN